MLSTILKKSSSSSSSSLGPNRALAVLASACHHFSSATSAAAVFEPRDVGRIRPFSSLFGLRSVAGGNGDKVREFHASGPLSFKASLVSQAQFAEDDFGYEEAGKGSGVGEEEGLEIAKLGISQEIVSALTRRGITKLFPIQKAVLQPAMEGRDMYGRARTGTGKTLAFGIPIINRILEFNAKHGRGRNPLALVMAPTRELARQVEKEFCESAPSLDTICLYGGTPITRQMRQLEYGIDVAVGTPGRIIDLMKRGALDLSEVQFVVLDEADQMLGVGFVDDIEVIFQRLPQKRQSMLFSATMPSWIKNLIRNYLKDPLTIDLVGDSDKKLADGITLYSIATEAYQRASILGPLITEHAKGGKCIIFTETKRDADRLANAMARHFRCEALHGDITQAQRERTLSGFRSGNFNILVATDVAARGLDVPNVDLIIHYAIPNSSETFVHRSGRTGRAGKKGTAILIHTQEENRQVRIFEREVGCRFTELPRITVEGGMEVDMGGRFGSFGGQRDRGFGFGSFGGQRDRGFGDTGRSDGYRDGYGRFGGRNSGSSRSDGYGGHTGGFGGSGRSDRTGGFGDFGSGRSNSFGGSVRSDRSGGFGDFGSGRSNSFGGSGRSDRPSAFGNFGSDRPSGFGDSARSDRPGSFGNFSASRSGRFGENNSSQSDSQSSRFGSFGTFENDNTSAGRRKF